MDEKNTAEIAASENEQSSRKQTIPEQDTGVLIAKTAVRTAVSAIVLLVLAVSLAVVFFPYQAMKAYMSFGMKSQALECAEKYISRKRDSYEEDAPELNSRYVTALYNACELSISLYTGAKKDGAKKERAAQVIRYTEEYLAVPGIMQNLDELSRYAVAHQSYYYHPSLYSYRDYLVRYNYIARCESGERNDRESFIYDGRPADIGVLESTFYNQSLEEILDSERLSGNSYTIDALAESLNVLSAMIVFDFKKAGVESFEGLSENDFGNIGKDLDVSYPWFYPLADRRTESNLSVLLDRIEEKFDMLKRAALKMPESDKREMLDKLYVFRSLSGFADNVWCALMTLSGNEAYNEGAGTADANRFLKWQSLNGVEDYSGSMRDYYNRELMPKYVKLLAEKQENV